MALSVASLSLPTHNFDFFLRVSLVSNGLFHSAVKLCLFVYQASFGR